jgi:hypothetical protein
MRIYHFQCVVFLCSLLAGGLTLAAESDSPDVNGDVWLVRTQGTWTEGERYGYYRVVVSRHLAEHSADTTAVQILEAKGDRLAHTLELLRSVDLPVPEYEGYIRDIMFSDVSADTIAIQFQIEAKYPVGNIFTRTFHVRTDGAFKELPRERRNTD